MLPKLLNPPDVTPTASGPRYREAYEHALPAAKALPLQELLTINIDVPTAVTMVVGRLPRLKSLGAAIAKALPEFDLGNIEQLETYTLATAHAHAVYLAAWAPGETIGKLKAEAAALRGALYSDAVALAYRGLVSWARLGEFKVAPGSKQVAFDLLGLAALLREAWGRVEGKTAFTLAELESAELSGERLLNAVAMREHGDVMRAEAIQLRQRCFTLFANAWDQIRRAVSFLRWDEDDVDDIVPSLYAGRSRRKTALTPEASALPPEAPAPGEVPVASGAWAAESPAPV